MTLKAKDVVKKIKTLAPLPDVCIKINQLADDPRASTHDIKRVIETDPALAARLLRIANSPFYGFSSKVDDLNRAVMLIGTQGLRDLVWGMSSITTFSKMNIKQVDMKAFWEHAVYTATVSKVLAKKCHVMNPDRLFLSGLLHDIGHLVLFQLMPDEMEVAFVSSQETGEKLILAEKNVLGFTHPSVSYALLKMWNLPESICHAVAYHHQPGKCEGHRLDAAIVHIADNIAKMAGKSGNSLKSQERIDANAWKITGLNEKIIDSVIRISDEQYKDAISIYLAAIKVAPAA